MKLIKKLSLLGLFAVTLTACSNDFTGDKVILKANEFLTDKNHILEEMSLETLIKELEYHKKGTKPSETKGEKDVELSDKDRKAVVIFGKQGEDRNDILAYLANQVAKSSDFKKTVGHVYLVNMASESSDFAAYINGEASEDTEDGHALSASGMNYESMLNILGIQKDINFKFDNQWSFGRKCSTLVEDEYDGKNGDNVKLEDKIPVSGCKNSTGYVTGTKLSEVTMLSFNKGVFTNDVYLFNEKVLDYDSIKLLYKHDEDNKIKKFKPIAQCEVFGNKCSDTGHVSIKSEVTRIFQGLK